MADHVLIGKQGVVTIRVSPGLLGEVLVPIRGGTEAFFARTFDEEPIEAGRRVVVVEQLSNRSVLVEPL